MSESILDTWRKIGHTIETEDDIAWEAASIIAAVLCVAEEVKTQTALTKKVFGEVKS